MWLLFAFGSAGAAGITAVLAKLGIKNVSSNVATALRTIVILIFAWLMAFVTGGVETINSISIHTMMFLVLSGLATGASWLCYFRALQLGDVNKVAPIDKSSTVLTMLLAFVFLGEGITWLKCVCMVLIGTGTYMMIEKKRASGVQTGGASGDCGVNDGAGSWKWLAYAGASAVFASLTSILGKIGISGVESNLGTAIRTVVVLIMAWVVVFVTKEQSDIRHIDRRSGIFLGLSGITTGVSWLCYYRALQTGPASVVVPTDKLSILVTIFFSYIILKEKLSIKAMTGLILITAGTLLLLL